jgi:translocation and assembly module TamB
MDLHATGHADLSVLDPLLAPSGRRARGNLMLDATVTGTPAAPRANGSARLAKGEIQDFAQGIRIADIQALIEAAGDRVQIAHLTGRAGPGTISASGSVGLAAPQPVDLHVTMAKARPLSSDRLTAQLDADLLLRGELQGRLDASGKITVLRAEIRVPDRLPSSIAVLDVRVPGEKPPPPPSPGPNIGLDIAVHSPGQMFVRGRGIDAELRGDLHLGGTAAAPRPDGGFVMRRGSISVAGTSLTFTTGKVTFDGSGKLDPTLDFVATSTSANVTATLEVTGYGSAPKITLSSVPALPQDEVLAHLLFGQPASSLSPFQLGEIALALVQLTGAPGSGLDPLGAARKALGLDTLSLGGGSGTSAGGATLQAGRYVAPGVYVGAKQGTSGAASQAQVQIDLYKGLKLETQVGTGGASATGAAAGTSSNGTGIGLTYQFEY